jgi:hypothetical protein
MKTYVKVIIGIAAGVVVLAGLFLAWDYFSGSGAARRLKAAESAAKAGEEAVKEAAGLRAKIAGFPAAWSKLTFDEDTEMGIIMEDLDNERGYAVESRRDPAAAGINKDISAAGRDLAALNRDLSRADTELKNAAGLRVPAETEKRVADAKKAVASELETVKDLRRGIEELRHDNDVWGFMALTLASGQWTLQKLAEAEAAAGAQDQAALTAAAAAAQQAVDECATLLTFARNELTNIGVQSADAERLLDFVSEVNESADAYAQAAACFGTSTEAQLKQALDSAAKQHAEARKFAEKNAIGGDYKTWFIARAEARL